MKIKNLGTLHSVSSGKMDENGRSSYSHLKLTFRLLLCAWIIACSWNQRGALWRQSWLLSCSLWSLSFFSAWRCFLEKQRWTCKKQDLKPLMAGNMAFCFKSWGLMFTDPHLAPSRQSRKLTQQLNPSASSLSFSSWSAITLYTCTQQNCASYLNPRKPTERPRPGHGLSSVHQVSCCNYADPFAKWSRFLPLRKRHSAELPLLLGSLIGKPMSWALNLTGDASKRWIPTTFSTSNHDWYLAWSAQHIQ